MNWETISRPGQDPRTWRIVRPRAEALGIVAFLMWLTGRDCVWGDLEPGVRCMIRIVNGGPGRSGLSISVYET